MTEREWDAISTLVAAAPEMSAEQVTRLRLLIRDGENDAGGVA